MPSSNSSRSRSTAPTPHLPPEDPPKPFSSSSSSSLRRSIAPSPHPLLSEDQKPLLHPKDEPSEVIMKRGQEAFRRSIAPEFEFGMGELIEGKVWPKIEEEEVKQEFEQEGEMGPPMLRGETRGRTWTPMNESEYGGSLDEDAAGEREWKREESSFRDDTPRSQASTLFSRNEDEEDDRDGREIDYEDDEEDQREGTIQGTPFDRETPEVDSSEQEVDSDEDSDEGGSKKEKKKRAGGHLTSEKRKRKGKGSKKGREPKKSKKELDKERTEQAARLTSDFFSQLPMDPPQPALISIKARLTNTVAASSSHLPPLHQVLQVRQPSPRRRSPTPPPLFQSRSPSPPLEPEYIPHASRSSSTASRPDPSIPMMEDDLVDYEEEDSLPPPEELLDGFGTKPKISLLDHDYFSEVGKPRRLESREEAIGRWKLEVGLESSNSRPIPSSCDWNSYRQTHEDLGSLLPSLSPPLPPLISLPRTFEAHPSLLTSLPPTSSQSRSIWSTILSSEPLRVDSDSRINRACWQLGEFSDQIGTERLLRDSERERVGMREFEGIATQVLEFEGDFGFQFDKIKGRNWLVTQQIVQLARIRKAHSRLSSPEIVNSLTNARHGRLQRLSTELERVKREYDGIENKNYIGNSGWILRLREEKEEVESEIEEIRDKFDRLEEHLRSVGELSQ